MQTKEYYDQKTIKMQRTQQNLIKRQFDCKILESSQEAVKFFLSQIDKTQSVGYGGSRTLEQIKIIEHLRENNYSLLDRNNPNLNKEEKNEIQKKILTCSVFISSVNGISETGGLINIDLWGNRINPITYGPDKVYIFAGWNKIEDDMEKTLYRVKNIACVQNAIRFRKNTPCTKAGRCSDCSSPDRICGTTTLHEWCPEKGRINILLIKEDLGF